jgi:hypothetical protein
LPPVLLALKWSKIFNYRKTSNYSTCTTIFNPKIFALAPSLCLSLKEVQYN